MKGIDPANRLIAAAARSCDEAAFAVSRRRCITASMFRARVGVRPSAAGVMGLSLFVLFIGKFTSSYPF